MRSCIFDVLHAVHVFFLIWNVARGYYVMKDHKKRRKNDPGTELISRGKKEKRAEITKAEVMERGYMMHLIYFSARL